MRYRLADAGPQTFDPVSAVDPMGVVDARGLLDRALSLFSPNSGSTGTPGPYRSQPAQGSQPPATSSGIPVVPIALALGAYLLLKRKRR